MALAGDVGIEPGRAELRLTRLTGSLGSDRLSPRAAADAVEARRRPRVFRSRARFRDRAGSPAAAACGASLCRSRSMPPICRSPRRPARSAIRNARGSLGITATLGGTLRAPQGHLSVNARDLTLASSKHSRLTGLGLGVDGNWNGRKLDLNGQVTGLKGDTISFGGSVPLLLTPSPLGISVPPDGRLACSSRAPGRSSTWPICCRSARTG